MTSDLRDEPFEGSGSLAADAQSLATAGSPGWLLQVRFGPSTVDVLLYGAPARELSQLRAGQQVRVQGTKHSWPTDPGEPAEWVVLAGQVEVIG